MKVETIEHVILAVEALMGGDKILCEAHINCATESLQRENKDAPEKIHTDSSTTNE